MKKTIRPLVAVGLILTLLSVAACEKSSDGYQSPNAEYVKEEVRVKLVYFQDWNDLAIQYRALAGQGLKEADYSFAKGPARAKLYAFSVLIPDSDECVIYMMDPRVDYKPEFIGHELVHCLMGRWHE